jgi:hypothetical protein
LFRLTSRIDGNFDSILEFSDNLAAVHHSLLFDSISLAVPRIA